MSGGHLVAGVAFALVAGCSKGSAPTSSSADAMPAAVAPPTAPSASSPTPSNSTKTTHTTSAMTFTLERVAYAGPTDLYDGTEPTNASARVVAKPTAPWQNFTFADLEKHDVRTLAAVVGEDAFRHIVTDRKLRQTMPGAPWTSEARLPLFFVRTPPRPGNPTTVQELAIVGFGEWQPTRYVVRLDSLWRITPER